MIGERERDEIKVIIIIMAKIVMKTMINVGYVILVKTIITIINNNYNYNNIIIHVTVVAIITIVIIILLLL